MRQVRSQLVEEKNMDKNTVRNKKNNKTATASISTHLLDDAMRALTTAATTETRTEFLKAKLPYFRAALREVDTMVAEGLMTQKTAIFHKIYLLKGVGIYLDTVPDIKIDNVPGKAPNTPSRVDKVDGMETTAVVEKHVVDDSAFISARGIAALVCVDEKEASKVTRGAVISKLAAAAGIFNCIPTDGGEKTWGYWDRVERNGKKLNDVWLYSRSHSLPIITVLLKEYLEERKFVPKSHSDQSVVDKVVSRWRKSGKLGVVDPTTLNPVQATN
jgi:hypothetical protein